MGGGWVPGYLCAPGPEVTSPFLLGDSRTHVLRKKVMALREGGGPGPPPLLPCSSSSPPGRRPLRPKRAAPLRAPHPAPTPNISGCPTPAFPPRMSLLLGIPRGGGAPPISARPSSAWGHATTHPSGSWSSFSPSKAPPEGRVLGGRALSALQCLSLPSSVTVCLDGPGRWSLCTPQSQAAGTFTSVK